MLDMFDLFTSSYPYILICLGTCALACIPASSHPHILMFVCTWLYLRILKSSYLQVRMPLLTSPHPHIHRFVCACLYSCILTSLYPHVHVCLLVSSHLYILVSSGFSVRTCLGNWNQSTWTYFHFTREPYLVSVARIGITTSTDKVNIILWN